SARANACSPFSVSDTKRWRLVERAETVSQPSFRNRRNVRVSVVESINKILESVLMGQGWALATATRMVNWVDRMPADWNERSKRRVTARAVRRKLRLGQ